tara:strand:- start:58 stop:252 length:195 start_codon:yes stop_codon:yes gene_type:complete
MVKAIQVIGPYSPKEFSGAGNDGTLSDRMTDDIEGLSGYVKTDIISVEPITVLGNVFLVVFAKT